MQVFFIQHQFKLQVASFQVALGNTLIRNAKLLVEECAWVKFDNPSGNGVSGQSSSFEIFLVVSWANTQHRAPSQTNYLGMHALYPMCPSSDFVAFSMAHLMPPSIRETLLEPNSEHVSDISTRLQQHLGPDCPLDLESLMERVQSDELYMDDEDADAVAEGKVLANKLLKLKHSNSRPNTYFSETSKVKLETSHFGTGEEAAMVRPALD